MLKTQKIKVYFFHIKPEKESYDFKSAYTFEVEELGPVGFYTSVDIIRPKRDGQFEILDTAVCMR